MREPMVIAAGSRPDSPLPKQNPMTSALVTSSGEFCMRTKK
ncbi:MAG: hypothetical protein ABIP13_06980 [Tepidiformaceae bacterium]